MKKRSSNNGFQSNTGLGRRDFLRQTGLGAVGALMSMTLARPAKASKSRPSRPNVVFILVDDMGWPDAGCYGNTFHETPNIDRLAAQGMRFTDAYAACPVCSPTRASIMSGQYPAHVGIIDFIPGHWRPYEKLRVPTNRTQYLPLEIVTVAEALKAEGYATGMFGKWHLGGRGYYPDKQGFDVMSVSRGTHNRVKLYPSRPLPPDAYLSEVLTEEADAFIKANRDRPFFLYLAHYAVHIPLQARQALIDKYEKKPKPATGVNNPIYAAMVEHVDNSVGAVMKQLDDLGLTENTLLIFFSDNGGLHQIFNGNGPIVSTNAPLRDEKGTVYEGGIREPLIVRWPGVVAPGTTCHEPVTSVDFFPTLLEATHAAPHQGQDLDGKSLVPLLKGRKHLGRDAIYWHYPMYHHGTPAGAIRMGDWKLIEFFDDNHLELYNLAEDIGETTNLAERHPRRAKRMQRKLAQWRVSVNAAMPTPNPDFDPDRRKEWGKHPA